MGDNLSIGTELSHYRIVARLGSGAGGSVYRAKDIRLGRHVAIKILPAMIAQDSTALSRFHREAKTVSLLSHPGICTLFDVGEHEGAPFLVLELLEGQTLQERIEQGQVAITELLDWGIGVADALEVAHEAGILHRDIKPGNLFLTKRGEIKILDFGLAKFQFPEEVDGSGANLMEEALTDSGVAVGTVVYMSPEQALGSGVDPRSDLFSLGSVLYEMATGEAPFRRRTMALIFDAILSHTPAPPDQLRPELPAELSPILLKCLEKERENRYGSAAELKAALEPLRNRFEAETEVAPQAPVPPTPRARASRHERLLEQLGSFFGTGSSAAIEARPGVHARRRRRALWLLAAALVVGSLFGGSLIGLLSLRPADTDPPAPEVRRLTSDGAYKSSPSLSPDGRKVAYVHGPGGFALQDSLGLHAGELYVKDLEIDAEPIRLTDTGAFDTSPVWSPDGRRLAFLRMLPDRISILTVSAGGGDPKTLLDLRGYSPAVGYLATVDWSDDGKWLVYSDRHLEDAPISVHRLSLESGETEVLTHPPKGTMGDFAPTLSADGQTIAFARSTSNNWGGHDIWVQSVDGGAPRQLTSGSYTYFRSLAFGDDGKEIFFSVPNESIFRVDLDGVVHSVPGVGRYATEASIRGRRMVYSQEIPRWLDIWRLDRPDGGWGNTQNVGEPEPLVDSTSTDGNADYSPDGRHIAFQSARSGTAAIWIAELDGTRARRLSNFGRHSGTPRWSPDGQVVLFDSLESGNWDLYSIDVWGGEPRQLTHDPADDGTGTWSRDGRFVYFHSSRSGSNQLWKLALDTGELVRITRDGGFYGVESRDGKYLYYSKTASRSGIWRSLPDGSEAVEVVSGPVNWSDWALGAGGLFYARSEIGIAHSIYSIWRFDLETEESTTIYRHEGSFDYRWLTVSPNEESLLFGRMSYARSELFLVEGHR